jgi:hypothetical protein
MNPHSSVRVVRIWCGERTNPILKCFVNPEGLKCGDLLAGVVHELANGLRLGIEVPSQDPSGAWVTIRG